jgi:hypothetical protein
MEDLYLSATTLLQVIAATEGHRQGDDLTYYAGVTAAAQRMGLQSLSNVRPGAAGRDSVKN